MDRQFGPLYAPILREIWAVGSLPDLAATPHRAKALILREAPMTTIPMLFFAILLGAGVVACLAAAALIFSTRKLD